MSKLSAAITFKITPDENEALDMLKQKGINKVDVFRRGLEAYLEDIRRNQESI